MSDAKKVVEDIVKVIWLFFHSGSAGVSGIQNDAVI